MAEPSVVANAAGAPGAAVAAAAADCETEVLDDEPRNILMGIIAQLRKGMDLHRVTLPTFVLEPRSMCERITDFLAHQDLLTPLKSDPVERFVDVVRYFLSGWHIRPKGVKKPFNPVLGEIFRCRWDLDNGTQSFYVCEQVLHHPPVSAYFYASPENGVVITGELRPRARFLGNSAATMMEGGSTVTFTSLDGETYHITPPNMYARGILFGTMYIELGDTATIRCPKTDLVCCIEFKTKVGWLAQHRRILPRDLKSSACRQRTMMLISLRGWCLDMTIATGLFRVVRKQRYFWKD
nr:hypothetical protein HK105_007777 [Polyrhizophydium stewartii]